MAIPRPRRRPARAYREPGVLFPNLRQLLPRVTFRSPAWRHFRTAQVEFLTGMQQLLHDCLEEMKLRERPSRDLKRIQVEE